MKEVHDILSEPLNVDDGHQLTQQLAKSESFGVFISLKHREAEETLSNMKGKLFNPSLSSEDKRKIDLEYNVRSYQREVNELSDLADLLKRRISLGQTLLKSMQAELQGGLR